MSPTLALLLDPRTSLIIISLNDVATKEPSFWHLFANYANQWCKRNGQILSQGIQEKHRGAKISVREAEDITQLSIICFEVRRKSLVKTAMISSFCMRSMTGDRT